MSTGDGLDHKSSLGIDWIKKQFRKNWWDDPDPPVLKLFFVWLDHTEISDTAGRSDLSRFTKISRKIHQAFPPEPGPRVGLRDQGRESLRGSSRGSGRPAGGPAGRSEPSRGGTFFLSTSSRTWGTQGRVS